MTLMRLPRFIVLQSRSNDNYLRYHKEDGDTHGYLKCSVEEAVMCPYVKYEVELPNDVEIATKTNYVHIRCCYNNKYLARCGKDRHWITASAIKTDERQKEWSCTLFEPIFVDGSNRTDVQLRHVQLGLLVRLDFGESGSYQSCLRAMEPPPSPSETNLDCDADGLDSLMKHYYSNIFRVVNWESLVVLPKNVAFKGHNGKYLKVFKDSPHDLVFETSDAGDPTVGHEVLPARDGTIRLKPSCLNKFWSRENNTQLDWVLAESDDDANDDMNAVFQPIRVHHNVIALRCLGNNMFCRLFYDDRCGKLNVNYLKADISTISEDVRLEVEELALSRTIYNVIYRTMDGRIYNESIKTMASGDAFNGTSVADTVDIALSYDVTTSKSWNFSGSWNFGIKASVKAGVPLIAEGQVEIHSQVTLGAQYTTTDTSTDKVKTVLKVIVPPMTRVKVSLIATEGTCDVPYSYTQCDTLVNGEMVIYDKDDGVFTGINSYNFKYETKEEAL